MTASLAEFYSLHFDLFIDRADELGLGGDIKNYVYDSLLPFHTFFRL